MQSTQLCFQQNIYLQSKIQKNFELEKTIEGFSNTKKIIEKCTLHKIINKFKGFFK